MSPSSHISIAPILGSIRSVPVRGRAIEPGAPPPLPMFVTISREPGAGANPVGKMFVEAMNADHSDEPWTYWDREIVEKVAADHHLSAKLIDGLDEKRHSWMSDFLMSLSFADSAVHYDDDRIYHQVKKTIRAIATAGRAVIIGRGGVFITQGMPGGIHIRLVAPFEQRVAYIAQQLQLAKKVAAARVREVEHNRRAFFRMRWPSETLEPEMFALTINTAEVGAEVIVQTLKALVTQRVAQTV